MTNTSRKRLAPLSLRLSENERARLTEWAGGQPISTYIKSVLFSDISSKTRSVSRLSVQDRQELSKLLAWLGQTRLAAHLAILANAADSGSLDMNEPVTKAVLKACSDIDYIRNILMSALGKQTPSTDVFSPSKLKLSTEEFKLLTQSFEQSSEHMR